MSTRGEVDFIMKNHTRINGTNLRLNLFGDLQEVRRLNLPQ